MALEKTVTAWCVSGKEVLFVGQDLAGLTERIKNIDGLSLTQVHALNEVADKAKSFDVIVSDLPDLAGIADQIFSLGKPGANFGFRLKQNDEAALRRAIIFAGFVDVHIENDDADWCVATATRPAYSLGSGVSIKTKQVVASSSVTVQNEKGSQNEAAARVWQLAADDLTGEEQLDSNTFLLEEDLRRPTGGRSAADCGVVVEGRRRACKNCSCGLAEEIENEEREKQAALAQTTMPKSSCGSCYLGDAFRCADCPYRGLPPFKPGERVTLNPN